MLLLHHHSLSSKFDIKTMSSTLEIQNYKSKLGFDYLIDFTIGEYVNHILRNIIYKREDDIFELKPKTPEELEAYKKEKGEPPEHMKILYDILHKQQIEHLAAVKGMMSLYKDM